MVAGIGVVVSGISLEVGGDILVVSGVGALPGGAVIAVSGVTVLEGAAVFAVGMGTASGSVGNISNDLDDLRDNEGSASEEGSTSGSAEEGAGVGGSESGSSFSTANSYGIDIDNLNFSNIVQSHTGRPYQDSKLLINEIIESKPPVPNPRGTNDLSWIGEGTFNGSTGYYELIIDPESNTVWHFVFKSQ